MDEASKEGNLFVTTTGCEDIILGQYVWTTISPEKVIGPRLPQGLGYVMNVYTCMMLVAF